MATQRLEGDLVVTGQGVFGSLIVPASTVTNASVSASADISASKLEHQYVDTFSQVGTAVANAGQVLSRVYGATCTVLQVAIGSIVAAVGDSTVTVDVKKNGTTILSAPVVLDSGNVAYTAELGTISVAAGAQANVYTVVITISAGTGTLPTGVYVVMTRSEKAA